MSRQIYELPGIIDFKQGINKQEQTMCKKKKQIDFIFFMYPVIDIEFCHHLLIHRYFDNILTKLMINNRTDG